MFESTAYKYLELDPLEHKNSLAQQKQNNQLKAADGVPPDGAVDPPVGTVALGIFFGIEGISNFKESAEIDGVAILIFEVS